MAAAARVVSPIEAGERALAAEGPDRILAVVEKEDVGISDPPRILVNCALGPIILGGLLVACT